MGTESKLNYAVSVGAVLSDALHGMKITQKLLSERTGVAKSIISEIINGKRKISVDVALAFEPVFNMPAQYWLGIQNNYEIAQKKSDMYLVGSDDAIKSGKNSAKDIAAWFINRVRNHVDELGEYITNLKLQKLLYFAQEKSLKLNNAALFNEPILHWKYGPVVEDVYHLYNGYGANPIIEAEEPELDKETVKLLESVYDDFKDYSASGLVTISHRRAAWLNSAEGEEITLESIRNS